MDGKIFYLTQAKLQELKKEHEELVAFERHKAMGEEAPKIFESEDLNPEFVSFQEDMSALRDRIEELQNILEHYELIKNPPKEQQGLVGIGATVALHVNGKQDEFMITGTLEANPVLGKISNESPVGKALLGHKVGDEVVVDHPHKMTYTIKNITYHVD